MNNEQIIRIVGKTASSGFPLDYTSLFVSHSEAIRWAKRMGHEVDYVETITAKEARLTYQQSTYTHLVFCKGEPLIGFDTEERAKQWIKNYCAAIVDGSVGPKSSLQGRTPYSFDAKINTYRTA